LPPIVNAAAWPGGTSLVLAMLRSFAIMLESVWWLLIEPEPLGPARR
jgi:hypothetical protein